MHGCTSVAGGMDAESDPGNPHEMEAAKPLLFGLDPGLRRGDEEWSPTSAGMTSQYGNVNLA